jgi:hypothetical protein
MKAAPGRLSIGPDLWRTNRDRGQLGIPVFSQAAADRKELRRAKSKASRKARRASR